MGGTSGVLLEIMFRSMSSFLQESNQALLFPDLDPSVKQVRLLIVLKFFLINYLDVTLVEIIKMWG